MEPIVVTNPEGLDRIPVQDAWFDPDEIVHDSALRTLALRFAQEPAQCEELPADFDDLPGPQLLRKAALTKEYRIAFCDWFVVVHNVRDVHADDSWADVCMLDALAFDPGRQAVSIASSSGVVTVTVDALRVEAALTPERIRWMRRRVGLFGFTSDSPY